MICEMQQELEKNANSVHLLLLRGHILERLSNDHKKAKMWSNVCTHFVERVKVTHEEIVRFHQQKDEEQRKSVLKSISSKEAELFKMKRQMSEFLSKNCEQELKTQLDQMEFLPKDVVELLKNV